MSKTNSNVPAFAKYLAEYASGKSKLAGTSANILVAMASMETLFTVEWLKKFHTATGSDKVSMLHGVLQEGYPGFDNLLETAKQSKKDLNNKQIGDQIEAQKTLKSIENIVREACIALTFLRLKNTSKWKVETKRIKYIIDGAWNHEIGDYFDTIVSRGRKVCEENKWIAPPKSAGKAGKAASNASSVSETVAKMEATGNAYPEAFKQMCNGYANLVEAKQIESLSEADLQAFRRAERATILKLFLDPKSGKVDLKLIDELYNSADQVAARLKKTDKPAEKVSNDKQAKKAAKVVPMTAEQAENLTKKVAVNQ